ncbi:MULTISPECIES: energy-coupling factor ABC transporter substrate-binding protein [Methanobacterium]|uniref:Cobalt transport protein CbiN n=1 Tax=Methanobacterium bryantii TaxID=2161 RepID=A0A2A2HAH8_METBR|nr:MULTISPECIES: energy-coupling factor ABC transporter substrate-binding protein [Methanobacterium]OEC88519.1 cobalt ABC transporter substrate-binding protein CbiN [Methanobacterium sp. A39]PAV06326.1 cobalamin biosynthesis protein CbiN [Methanobacterium bryantii]
MVDKKPIILLILVAAIVIFPLAIYNGLGEDQGYFGGADDQGSEAIEETGYEPWAQPLWEPPSGEIESLLFATQAAIGAIIIGYVLGYYSGQAKARKRDEIEEQVIKTAKISK